MSPAASAAVYSLADSAISRGGRRASDERRIVNAPSTAWSNAVWDRLDYLLKLPVGWDGYKAPAVRFENAYFAMQLLLSICPEDITAPQIVPGSRGDLQIEWHTAGTTIELHVKAPNDVSGWRETQANPDGEELHLSNNFIEVARWLRELQGDYVAAVTTAA